MKYFFVLQEPVNVFLVGASESVFLQEPVKVAEVSRPGTGMYGGNLELVSRRENVQVLKGDFVLKKILSVSGECTEGVL